MRMPSFSRSYSTWADYLLEQDMTVDDAIEKTSSEAVASWLEDSRSMLDDALSEKGTATATFMTQGDIMDDPEEEEDVDDVLPAKGIRV